MTVYRRLQVRLLLQLVGKKIDYGLFRNFWELFCQKLSLSYGSIHFSDFSGVKWHSAEAHPKGFAPLLTFRWGLTRGLPTTRVAKNMTLKKIEKSEEFEVSLGCSQSSRRFKNLCFLGSYFLSVSPAVTRLTVYRRLQVKCVTRPLASLDL